MNVLWLRKPKCAGNSIRKMFETYSRLTTEPGALTVCHAYNLEEGGTNVGLQVFRRKYPDFFKAAWKFTVVRNPWDKVVSSWHYCASTRDKPLREVLMNPPRLPEVLDRDRLLEQIHDWHHFTRTQYELGSDENGNFVADYIARFEDLPESLDPVFDRLGISDVRLPKLNTTDHRHYRDYFDKETKALVGKLFSRDIEYFGYEF